MNNGKITNRTKNHMIVDPEIIHSDNTHWWNGDNQEVF